MSKYVLLEIEKQEASNPSIKFNGQPLKIPTDGESVNPLSVVARGLIREGIFFQKIIDKKHPIETTIRALAPEEREEIGALHSLMIECSNISLDKLKYIIIRNILYRCYAKFQDEYEIKDNLTFAEAMRESDICMKNHIPSAIEPHKECYRVKVLARKAA